jgi:hypothetical protein
VGEPAERVVGPPQAEIEPLTDFPAQLVGLGDPGVLDELGSRGEPDWSRCAIDSVSVRAVSVRAVSVRAVKGGY